MRDAEEWNPWMLIRGSEFWTGTGWSAEYPDACKYRSKYAAVVAGQKIPAHLRSLVRAVSLTEYDTGVTDRGQL